MSAWATKPQSGKNTTITDLGAVSKSAELKGGDKQFHRLVVSGGKAHIRTGPSTDAALATDPVYEEGTELIQAEKTGHTHLHALAADGATGVVIHVCPILAIRP